MLCAEFAVTVSATLGPRAGRLTLQIDNDTVMGCLTLLGSENYLQGKVLRKNCYVASFTMQMGEELLECDVLLRIRGGQIWGAILSERGCWEMDGARLSGGE